MPLKDRSPEAMTAQDPTTGCRGCSSGVGQHRNIFGNKYGQNLAAVQVAREKRMEEMEQKRLREEEATNVAAAASAAAGGGDSETDDDSDDDDYGPTPAAWASEGGKLEAESERLAEVAAGGEDDSDDYEQPAKKLKSSS